MCCSVYSLPPGGASESQLADHSDHSAASGRNVGSRWALEQAKYNLVNEYLLVGVTEELEDFIMILEAALPRYFRGATELYRTGNQVVPPLTSLQIHFRWT